MKPEMRPSKRGPRGEAVSDVVEVTRDDNASNLCQESTSKTEASRPSPSAVVRPEPSDSPQPRPSNEERPVALASDNFNRLTGSPWSGRLAIVVPVLFWLILAWLPAHINRVRE